MTPPSSHFPLDKLRALKVPAPPLALGFVVVERKCTFMVMGRCVAAQNSMNINIFSLAHCPSVSLCHRVLTISKCQMKGPCYYDTLSLNIIYSFG